MIMVSKKSENLTSEHRAGEVRLLLPLEMYAGEYDMPLRFGAHHVVSRYTVSSDLTTLC